MQIVLDTNVLVSGLLSATGPPGRIVEAALAGHLELRTLTEITLPCATRANPPTTGCAWVQLATLYRSLSLDSTMRFVESTRTYSGDRSWRCHRVASMFCLQPSTNSVVE